MVQSLDRKEYKQQLGVTLGYREQLQLLDRGQNCQGASAMCHKHSSNL